MFCSAACQSRSYRRRFPEKRWAIYLQRKPAQLEYNRKRRQRLRALYPWLPAIESAKQRAKQKGVGFDLTAAWAKQVWTGRCALTGLPFSNTSGLGPGPKRLAPSIDRINAKKGYTQSNCRFVLLAINSFKHDGTDAQMLALAKALCEAQGVTIQAPRGPTQG